MPIKCGLLFDNHNRLPNKNGKIIIKTLGTYLIPIGTKIKTSKSIGLSRKPFPKFTLRISPKGKSAKKANNKNSTIFVFVLAIILSKKGRNEYSS